MFDKLRDVLLASGNASSLEPVASRFVDDSRAQTNTNWQVTLLGSYASLLTRNGKPDQARPFAEEATKLCQAQPPVKGDLWTASIALGALADSLERLGETNQLEANALQLLNATRAQTSDTPAFARLLAEVTAIFRLHNKPSQARPLAEEAMAIFRRYPDRFEPWLQGLVFDNLIAILQAQGSQAELESLSREQTAFQKKHTTEKEPVTTEQKSAER